MAGDLSQDEIKSLRSELAGLSNQVVDLTKFAVTASALLVGYALNAGGASGALIALLPLGILAPLMQLALNRRLNLLRIATYLRAYSGENFRYEARLHEFRKHAHMSWPSYALGTVGTLVVSGILCLVVSALIALAGRAWGALLITLMASAWWTAHSRRASADMKQATMGGDLEKRAFQLWGQVRDAEGPKGG